MKRVKFGGLLMALSWIAVSEGTTLLISNEHGDVMSRVMVTQTPLVAPVADLSDDGYTPHGVSNQSAPEVTRFSDAQGRVSFDDTVEAARYRIRAQGYVDVNLAELEGDVPVSMTPMSERALIASYPSNVWLSQLTFGGDDAMKKHFQLNCAFCHQQASPFMRNERTLDQWKNVIDRMNGYGARLADADHADIAKHLQQEYRTLRENPDRVPAPKRWEAHLSEIEMTEWPIGDGFSQMHDFILHPNGYVYVGDNLHDRIYQVDPETGQYTVYKVPHEEEALPGGILGNRFSTFGKMHNYMGVHSFAISPKDGNIFITASMKQALLEFNPETKAFTTHSMPEGFYPHTVRTDANDRVWFTLALSSQVAMFDRTSGEFTMFDLPARSIKEWLTLKMLPLLFMIDPEYRPLPEKTRESIGLPMPYGIDVAPDGTVWAARLNANDLARIDPETGEVTMIDVPYNGPRRLRVDANNKVWLVAFQDSLLVKYDPETGEFSDYDLPVINELPYALNVDRSRGRVWVNGNQSDTILSFDIDSETWKVYPMPRQRFFTRDIEVAEDGSIFTSNSHFPAWQTEGGVPTLLRITPLADTGKSGPDVDAKP